MSAKPLPIRVKPIRVSSIAPLIAKRAFTAPRLSLGHPFPVHAVDWLELLASVRAFVASRGGWKFIFARGAPASERGQV